MEDVLDIVHKITFETEEKQLDKMTSQLRESAAQIGKLTQKNVEYARLLKKMSHDEVEGRQRILSYMGKNKEAIDQNRKALENFVLTDKTFHNQLVKEQGLIGALTSKLKILEQQRKSATSEDEVKRYSNLIAQEREKIRNLRTADQKSSVKGSSFLGLNGVSGVMGVASRALPALGGALALGSVGSQIVDVTKKFESYIKTLENAYGSATKAQIAFGKIQQFAAKTPYSVDELTSSFIKLKNRGFDPTTEEMTKMGDLASSQGKSFDQYVEALLDAQTGEYERLKEFGIKAKTVGDQVTLSFKGVEKQVKKTDQEAIRNAIISFGELQGVAGGMSGQAETLNGKLSNLGDTWDMLLYNFSNNAGISNFLGGIIDAANDLLGLLNDVLDKSDEIAAQARQDALWAGKLADEYENLSQKTKLTNDEKDRMLIIQGQLVSKFGDSITMIDKETGAIILNTKAVRELIKQKLQLSNSKILEKVQDFRVLKTKAEDLTTQVQQAIKLKEAFERRNPKIKKEYEKDVQLQMNSFTPYGTSYYNPDGNSPELKAYKEAINTISSYTMNYGKIAKEMNKIREKTKKDFNADVYLLDKEEEESLKRQMGLIEELEKKDKPTTNTPSTKTAKPKKGGGKTPQQIELDKINENTEAERQKELKRHNDYITEQNKLREKDAISIEQYHSRIEREEQTHKGNLAQIEKASAQRKQSVKGQKKSDYEGYNATISTSDKTLSEIAAENKEKAEQQIKEAISDFERLNEEFLNISDKSFENEMVALESQHQKRLKSIQEQRKKEEEAKKIALEEGNIELANQIQANIDKSHEIEKATKEKYHNDKINLEIDHALKENEAKFSIIASGIHSLTEKEKEEFDKKYNRKAQEVEKELNQMRDSVISDEEILKARGGRREKLREEQAKQEERIERKKHLALQYLEKENTEAKLKILIEKSATLSGEQKRQNDEEISRLQTHLSVILGLIAKGSKDEAKIQEADKKKKEDEDKAKRDGIFQMAEATIQAGQTIVAALEAQTDQEIEVRERRVSKAKEIADRGNAEALQLEEKRLDQAQKQKEKYARQQMALNLLQQASALALAIAQAASTPFPANLAAIASVITAVGAGIATVTQMTSNTPAFKDGVVDFQGKGTATSDSNLVRISRGESVITAEATRKNAQILREMNEGKVFQMTDFNKMNSGIHIINQNNVKTEIADMRAELVEIKKAIQEKEPTQLVFDEHGILAVTEAITLKTKRRWGI